jgi:hypothetical protein
MKSETSSWCFKTTDFLCGLRSVEPIPLEEYGWAEDILFAGLPTRERKNTIKVNKMLTVTVLNSTGIQTLSRSTVAPKQQI